MANVMCTHPSTKKGPTQQCHRTVIPIIHVHVLSHIPTLHRYMHNVYFCYEIIQLYIHVPDHVHVHAVQCYMCTCMYIHVHCRCMCNLGAPLGLTRHIEFISPSLSEDVLSSI